MINNANSAHQADKLCDQFINTLPPKLLRALYADIKAAAKTSEPWSAVAQVLEDFPSVYHQKHRQVTLDFVEIRELEIGKNGLCSFVFYLSNADGNHAGIMDFVELDTSKPQNTSALKAINQSTAVARAQRLLAVGVSNESLHKKRRD